MKSDRFLIKASTIPTNTEVECSFDDLLSSIRKAFKISDDAYYLDGEAWYNTDGYHGKVFEHRLKYNEEQISALRHIEELKSIYIKFKSYYETEESCTWEMVLNSDDTCKAINCPHCSDNQIWNNVFILDQLEYCPYCKKHINFKYERRNDNVHSDR